MTSDAGTITATLDQDGVFTISGTGAMPDYGYSRDIPWNAIKSKFKKVVIKEGITTISDYAFMDCGELTSVTIPSTVTSLGIQCFRYCGDLTSVEIPDSVKTIGVSAFSGSGLTSVEIPDSVETIGGGAFSGSSLTSVEIPGNVTTIGGAVFASCNDLTSLTVNANADTVGNGFASDCRKLTTVDLSGSTLKSISFDCFKNSYELSEVIFPETLEEINSWSFEGCSKLKLPVWPASISFISTNAFIFVNQYRMFENIFPDDWLPYWLARNPDRDFVPREIDFPYTDVPEDYPFYSEIREMYMRGMMTGTTPTTFEPETTLNRAFLAAVLYRRAGRPAQTYDGRFPDVNADDWFMPSVMWSSASGNIVGYNDGHFGPTDNLTREQLCTVLWRTAMTMDGCDNSARESLSDYPDAANVSEYAKEALEWCQAKGVLVPRDGKIAAWNPATRAELAAMLSRYLKAVGR